MTISSTQTRISYNGNGVTTEFAFPYLFLAAADLEVRLVAANGAVTLLTLNTDYTVTGVGDDNGGEITLNVAPAVGQRLVLNRVMDLVQEIDYITGDPFPAQTHERGLDRLTMMVQQHEERLDRTLQLPITSEADASAIDPEAVEVVAGIADEVTAVALIDDDVSTVAGIDDDVSTVAGISGNVTTVAGISSNVTSVAGNASNINTVATNISNVNAVGSNITNVNAVAGNATNINAVNANSTNINTVAGNTTNINTVAGISSNVTTVAGISSEIGTVVANITDIQNAEENADAAIAAKIAAETARDQTLAAFDSFDDRYLGTKSSDPTLDNDGNALVAGALYFNSVSGIMKVYTGTVWVAAYVQGNAVDIGFTPAGNIAATNVQAAIQELDTEKISTTAIGVSVQAYDADTAKTDVVQSFTAAQRGTIVALTDGATITPDFAAGNNFSVTLGGSRTLANPTNLTAGQSGVIVVTQDGTGGRTLAFGSNWKFPGGTAPTLTTTAAAVDVIAYYVESSSRITARLVGDVK
jgi:hypothetical protein